MYNKIKPLISNDAVFYGLLITLVAVAAFGLGRMSVMSPVPTPTAVAAIPPADALASTTGRTGVGNDAAFATSSERGATDGTLVASKNGSRYHYLWCPGARTIKETNKVFFTNPAAARAAGYTPAANCPGLE